MTTRLPRTEMWKQIEQFHDCGIFEHARTISMGSITVPLDEEEAGTDFRMADQVIKNLYILEAINQEPITIIMNNPGGDVTHGMAIYDAIQACKSHVTIRANGHAMSMGSIILQAADHRVMMPNAHFMIHYGHLGLDHHSKTAHQWADWDKKFCKQMEDIYLEKIKKVHPKYTRAKLKTLLNFDSILSSKETLELGLIDEITTPP